MTRKPSCQLFLLCLFAALSAAGRDTNQVNQTQDAKPGDKTRTPSFEVNRYELQGNTILKQKVIDEIFSKFTGKAITIEDVRKALGELQLAYRERGYVTVGISLPQQQVTNGTVHVNVVESKLADIRVRGNKHYSRKNVLRALPSLHTQALLNTHIFQNELDQANANRDRQIYPKVEPGPLPGTSALVLNVKDRFPLHARAEVDNYSTPGTPDLRINLSAQYNNLWQRDHQLGVSYGFSPEQFKADGLMPNYLFDAPLISYYGTYYRIPLGGKSVEEKIGNNNRFGYNEATHQFVLPPSGDNPDLTFYASASASDTGVKFGEPTEIYSSSLGSATNVNAQRNLGINENLGVRFSQPFITEKNFRLSGFVGADYKQYSLTSFSTNLNYIYTPNDPSTGFQGTNSVTPAPFPTVKDHVHYLPVNAGVDVFESDKTGTTSANFTTSLNLLGNKNDFVALGYSPKVVSHFAKFSLNFSREQSLINKYSLIAKAGAQASTSPLISNEQFALGGNNNIRGYYEGDDYGDSGWYSSAEIRTPYWETSVSGLKDYVPVWLRGSIFADYGQRYLADSRQGLSATRSLLGTGFGITANVNNHFDARVMVAFPMLSTANTKSGSTHIYFSLGGQF